MVDHIGRGEVFDNSVHYDRLAAFHALTYCALHARNLPMDADSVAFEAREAVHVDANPGYSRSR
jgi:hypothetical protein